MPAERPLEPPPDRLGGEHGDRDPPLGELHRGDEPHDPGTDDEDGGTGMRHERERYPAPRTPTRPFPTLGP